MQKTTKYSVQEVQKYLSSGKTIDDFQIEHGIKGKSDGNHIILDYDLLKVNWSKPYGYVCRGLILCAKTYEVLCLGLPKFFNAGEGYASEIDWKTAKVIEKLDGTLFFRWYSPHTKKFEYSTRFQLPCELELNKVFSHNVTWKQLLDMASANSRYQNIYGERYTISYEVMSSLNKNIIQYAKPQMKIISVRNNLTLKEEDIFDGRLRDFVPKTFNVNNYADAIKLANSEPGSKLEGLVILSGGKSNEDLSRIKIKNRKYVHLHNLSSHVQILDNLLAIVRNGEYDEVAAYFPHLINLMDKCKLSIENLKRTHESAYNSNKDIISQKEFALSISKLNLPGVSLLFNTRSGRSKSIEHALMSLDEKQFINLCKNFDKALISE